MAVSEASLGRPLSANVVAQVVRHVFYLWRQPPHVPRYPFTPRVCGGWENGLRAVGKISDIMGMSQPPITPEQLATLPPEYHSLLQAVIDHYEQRMAALEGELAAVRAELEATK